MKKSEKICTIICLIIFAWLIASYINTISHNMTDYNYAWWNVFSVFCGIKAVE